MTTQGSYKIQQFAADSENEIRRLKAQLDLFWEKELVFYRMYGMKDDISIVECGSGPGFMTQKLLKTFPGCHVTAIEIDPYLVEYHRGNMEGHDQERFEIFERSIMETGLEDNAYDFVVSRLVLEHLPDPVGAVREAFRILKPGGIAVFVDNDFEFHLRTYPDVPELRDLYEAYCNARYDDGGNPRIGRELPVILSSGGFSNVDLQIVSAHNEVIGDEMFLRSEGSGIPSQLLNDGYLSQDVLDNLTVKWHALLQEENHSIFRQLFIGSGKKVLNKKAKKTTTKYNLKSAKKASTQKIKSKKEYVASINEIEKEITKIWQDILEMEVIGSNDNFFSLGGDSFLLVEAYNRLQEIIDRKISITDMFKYPTIGKLAYFLSVEKDEGAIQEDFSNRLKKQKGNLARKKNLLNNRRKLVNNQQDEIDGLAVIGFSGRFPGAKDVEAFWSNLRNGVESISVYSDDDLASEGVSSEMINHPRYVKNEFLLDDVEMFDAAFFGINPREALIIDPQQRLFLESAWHAFEHAGYNPEKHDGSIGVFAGTSLNDYIFNLRSASYKSDDIVDDFQRIISIDKDFLSTRVSYKFDLKGPSSTIQTGCSTSLVAVHMACQSLLNYECDMALAGGVCIKLPQRSGYFFQEGMLLSPDGHCHAFDAKSKGTGFGNGLGIVVLKRASDALKDGDTIHAVIKGSAINNDGSDKLSFVAPGVNGQAEVIATAQALAQVNPETITYHEAHGTGTALGDPIEIAALTQAFNLHTQKKQYCAIGSVKTNVGHLDAAAGVTGLIKTVLALEHGEIPPSLNYEKPNPEIDFENSPFYVNTKLTEWKRRGAPRRASVSSFGVGGTNAHVVLEEAPKMQTAEEDSSHQLLLLSARSRNALDEATINLVKHLKQHPKQSLSDVAYTLQVGRKAFDHRRMVVCHDHNDAINNLEAMLDSDSVMNRSKPLNRDVVFMFSGQGSQYVNMTLELYNSEPTFQREIDKCSEILNPYLLFDLREVLYPKSENTEEAAEKLKQTFITQPSLFVIEYALAKLWMSWGVNPVALVGHSIGEYVAACLSGVISLEDALALVATRGQLIQELPGGSMLAVQLTEEAVQPLLNKHLSLAVINSPSTCVISGEDKDIDELKKQLADKELNFRDLHTSHAFHSMMMEPIIEEFTEKVSKVTLNVPEIPFVSNVTGTWITADDAVSSEYWAQHLRQTVRFSDCIETLLNESNKVLIEVGPGNTLSTLSRQQSNKSNGKHIVVPTTRHPYEEKSDMAVILNALGSLWAAGINVDWERLHVNEERYRIPLPTYPFERKRYWIEPRKQAIIGEEVEENDTRNRGEIERDKIEISRNTAEDDIVRAISVMWQELLGVNEVGRNDDFFEMGGNSLLAVSLFGEIEKKFARKLPVATLLNAPTIKELAEIIKGSKQEISWSSLVEITPGNSKPPLFCMHSAGGSVLEYKPLADYLGSDQPFYSLQAKGLDEILAEECNVEDMARQYLSEIRNIQPKGPYFLGGYCLGGLLAYEMAQQLRNVGEEVALLAIINVRTADYINKVKSKMSIIGRVSERIKFELTILNKISLKEKFFYILNKTRTNIARVLVAVNGKDKLFSSNYRLNSEKHSPLLKLQLLTQIHDDAGMKYVPQPYQGHVTHFTASRQPEYLILDPTLGWDGLVKGDVEICEIPAHHKDIIKEPNVKMVAEKMKACIENAQCLAKNSEQ